jgi:endonuclease/exonuclease/phosphatase (EEP) superfamily protein YafD
MIDFLTVLSIVLITAVFITRVRSDFWIYKILEYPRMQKFVLVMLVLAGWAFYWQDLETGHWVVAGALALSAGYLVYKISPYTFLTSKEMKLVRDGVPENSIKLFAANVYQENQQYRRLLEQIRAMDPDIIFLLETNRAWADAVQELGKDYPFQLLEPLENTYGLLFYSRLKLEKAAVRYLVKNDIPSIEAIACLPSGQKVQLYGLHPEPPVPGENLYSTAKDKELMKIAFKVRDCSLPCIVFGDLNDVAWSHITELFRKTSTLLDPRRGRGFYSTFSAHHWFLRFPLDYVFCSNDFGLVNMRRMPKNGSDHFATFVHLSYQKRLEQEQEAPEADGKEISEAVEVSQK